MFFPVKKIMIYLGQAQKTIWLKIIGLGEGIDELVSKSDINYSVHKLI